MDSNLVVVAAPSSTAAPLPGGDAGEFSAPGRDRRLTIVIVGSGPSGCYVAQFLAKKWPEAEITIVESLPTPYGLVRYGVAADHQGAKNVTRQFDRLFTRDGVRFVGNVSVGRDIDFDRLARCFDIVVLATGLPEDRPLGIPQACYTRVVGAGALLRSLNGYPVPVLPRDALGQCISLGRQLAVVGMGNVAIDVLRLLSKDSDAFCNSDIDDELLAQLRPATPLTIDVIGRSPAPEAKFDLAMLRELVSLPNIGVVVTGLDDHDHGPVADLLRPFANAAPGAVNSTHTQVRLHFGLTPEAIESADGRTLLRARPRGKDRPPVEFVVDTVITAVGFTHGAPDDLCCPSVGWSGTHVYRVGWLNRGAKGTIPDNRKDAQQVAGAIADDLAAGRIQAGRPGFAAVEPALFASAVSFTAWQRIDTFERRSATPDRCRRKISNVEQMLAIATDSDANAATHDTPQMQQRYGRKANA